VAATSATPTKNSTSSWSFCRGLIAVQGRPSTPVSMNV
jgi:hypothetical protein